MSANGDNTMVRGRRHWLWQRASALGLLLGGTILTLNGGVFLSHSTAAAWLASGLGAAAAAVFALSLFAHSHLGVVNIIEDYVHDRPLKRLLVVVSYLYALVGVAVSLLSIIALIWAWNPDMGVELGGLGEIEKLWR